MKPQIPNPKNQQKPNIALVYDADYTLMNGYHPTLILESRGYAPEEIQAFWQDVITRQKTAEQEGDNVSLDGIYVSKFMDEVRHGKLKGLSIDEIRQTGKNIANILFPGIPGFFRRVRQQNPNSNISHNIVSVGMRPMLQGCPELNENMDRIYGYSFYDDFRAGRQIDELKGSLSSREKIPAIVKISRGNFKEWYQYPIKDMIYFGDGQTDVPAFIFVTDEGHDGTAVCLYRSEETRQQAEKIKQRIMRDAEKKGKSRPNMHVLPVDYKKGGVIERFVYDHCKRREA